MKEEENSQNYKESTHCSKNWRKKRNSNEKKKKSENKNK
jgi:hypothetical protein